MRLTMFDIKIVNVITNSDDQIKSGFRKNFKKTQSTQIKTFCTNYKKRNRDSKKGDAAVLRL